MIDTNDERMCSDMMTPRNVAEMLQPLFQQRQWKWYRPARGLVVPTVEDIEQELRKLIGESLALAEQEGRACYTATGRLYAYACYPPGLTDFGLVCGTRLYDHYLDEE